MIEIKDIGQLDSRVTLKMYTQTVSGNGERIDTWSVYGTVWALKEYTGASEAISDDMSLPDNRVNFYIRYNENVNEKWRVNSEGKEYSINGIQEIGRDVYMMLQCETITLVNSGIDIPLTFDNDDISLDSELITLDQEKL